MGDPVPSSAISDATTGGLSVIVVTGGSTGDVLTKQSDGTYLPVTPSSGGITGSVGSTDNRLVRSNGTGGSTVQSTGITVDDSDNITIGGSINLTRGGVVITDIRAGTYNGEISIGVDGQGGYFNTNNVAIQLRPTGRFAWASTAANNGNSSYVAGLSQSSGVVEINNGTSGTYRDLIVRNFRMASPTLVPASASATGSAGQIAWDADYIYVCTATNTWKRVAIATW